MCHDKLTVKTIAKNENNWKMQHIAAFASTENIRVRKMHKAERHIWLWPTNKKQTVHNLMYNCLKAI